ncbi:twin-arginine translocation signal domain-containing protein [Natrialba sp. SSL1]|uniref:twin-arginine translocation signal domain-containing protein n=1 Tax=Natrialba sp. SSL1 TaxID=1869245 RepID=UPI0008F89EB3|nr:twin-arginine translocation signal domain-containing protein [Natrialba sp. SSL1]OIB57430.1 hypothetical protein BBD46_11520 [Natrialba sp. SSL1]
MTSAISTDETRSTDSPQPTPTAHDSESVSRRGFLERSAIAGGALITLSAAGDRVAPKYSPIGQVQAIPPAAIGFYLASGAAAGITTGSILWHEPGTDLDPEDVLEDQLYEAAASVADGREAFVDEMEQEFLGPDDPQDTPYGRVAWQEIRAAAVRAIVDGGSQEDAVDAAHDALDKQTTRSVINIVERRNTGLNALVQQLTLDVEESIGVFEHVEFESGNTRGLALSTASEEEDVENIDWLRPIEASQTEDAADDEFVMYEWKVDLPVDPTELEGRDEPLWEIGLGHTSGSDSLYGAAVETEWAQNWDEYGIHTDDSYSLVAEHSDLGETTVLDTGEITSEVLAVVETAYTDIRGDVQTYVSNLYDGVQQGAIDPADVLSSQDIVDEFGDSDDQARVAAELLAIGANVPDSASYRATISHPDLQADELEGLLYPQFDGEAMNLRSGMTLESEDYRMAYFGYESAVDDGFETTTLSGEEALEIHSVSGLEDEISIEDEYEPEAGVDGEVILWTGSGAPEPITDSAEHDGWQIVVTGETTDHVADVSEAVEDGEQWILETTDLAEGEAIESVEVVPSVEYSRSIDYVADPTEVDGDETIERMENLREQVDDLEEALEDDSSPGLTFPDDPFETTGGVLAGIAIIGAAIAVVVGVVTNLLPFGGD